MYSLNVTVETALTPQLQPTDLTVKPQSLVLSPGVMPEGGLSLAGVGAAGGLTTIVLELVRVSDVLAHQSRSAGVEVAA